MSYKIYFLQYHDYDIHDEWIVVSDSFEEALKILQKDDLFFESMERIREDKDWWYVYTRRVWGDQKSGPVFKIELLVEDFEFNKRY